MINRDIIDTSNYLPDNNTYQKMRGEKMSITYNKLWKLLIDLNMTKTELKDAAKVSSNVIAKMGKKESVSIDSLVKIRLALNVDVGDVISIDYEGRRAS